MPEIIPDHFFKGSLTVLQPAAGYRFSVDAVLLAGYAGTAPRILDLGCGCGIISLLQARRDAQALCYGVEIQPELAFLARRNILINGLDDRITIIQQDMQTLAPNQIGGPLTLVVSNPPFYALGSGRCNPNNMRAYARHEVLITLPGLLAAARRLLVKHGHLALVYATTRLAELFDRMREYDLEPCHLRLVHPHPQAPARLALVTGRKQGHTGLTIAPPLIMYQADGRPAPELNRFFEI